MFASLRIVVSLVVAVMILGGALLATAVINATSGGSPPALTSPAAIAAATRSLPADWMVRPGDSFTSIAARTHLSVSQLQQLNPTQDPNALLPGEHLRLHLHTPRPNVPRRVLPGFWIVRAGQTYTSIAARTGLPVPDIAQFNPRANPNALVPGQRLKLRP